MEQNLLNYIKENLAKGVPQDQIRQTLTASGWGPTDVDSAFNQLASPQPITHTGPPVNPLRSFFKSKTLLLGILAVILIASAGGGTYIYFTKQRVEPDRLFEAEKTEHSRSQAEAKLSPPPAASSNPSAIDASLKAYTSTEFKYKVEIPANWAWKEFSQNDTGDTSTVVFGNEQLVANLNYQNVEDTNNVQILSFPSSSSLKALIDSNFNPNFKWEDGKPVIVGGVEARQFEKPYFNDQPGVFYLTTFVQYGANVFIVTGNFVPPVFSPEFDKLEKESATQIYNKILASMTFLQ